MSFQYSPKFLKMQIKTALIAIILFSCTTLFAQSSLKLQAPSPGKSVVYFVILSSMRALINFTFLDSAQVIGRFNGVNHMRYECDPGYHLFWARSENRDFIDAELEPDQIYFVESLPLMGMVKAGVELIPVAYSNTKRLNKIAKLMEKKDPITFSESFLDALQIESVPLIERGVKTKNIEKSSGMKYH